MKDFDKQCMKGFEKPSLLKEVPVTYSGGTTGCCVLCNQKQNEIDKLKQLLDEADTLISLTTEDKDGYSIFLHAQNWRGEYKITSTP